MRKLAVTFAAAAVVALVVAACGGGGDSATKELAGEDGAHGLAVRPTPTPAPFPTTAPAPFGSGASDAAVGAFQIGPAGPAGPQGAPGPRAPSSGERAFAPVLAGGLSLLETAGRQVIATSSLTLTTDDIPGALTQARIIAESLGGFVETLNSSGGDHQSASVTLRVPTPEFFNALERLKALGEVVEQSVGSQDVTDQQIDLEARLKSAQREEISLLGLLDRAGNVTEILTVERELTRVRSEIERLQGQLTFLESRVELATISLRLFPPTVRIGNPPSAELGVAVREVTSAVGEIRRLVEGLDGIVDNSFLSVIDGDERGEITFRIFAERFDETVISLERLGEVSRKIISQGGGQIAGEPKPEEPASRVTVSLTQLPPDEDSNLAGVLALSSAGPVVVIVLMYGAFRVGRRRAA